MNNLLVFEKIIGSIGADDYSEKIHSLSHQDKIEYIKIDTADLSRKKFRAYTTTGRECAISLSRDSQLENGSILLLEDDLAIVLKTNELQWLKIKPKDIGSAIELGYFAGNMHWQVKFSENFLYIALNLPVDTYLSRLHEFISSNSIEVFEHD